MTMTTMHSLFPWLQQRRRRRRLREREGSGSARAACSRAPGWRGVRGKGGKERKKRKKAPREEAAWLEEEKCGWLLNSLAELPGRLAPDEPDAGCRRPVGLFGQTENIDSGQSEPPWSDAPSASLEVEEKGTGEVSKGSEMSAALPKQVAGSNKAGCCRCCHALLRNG